MLFYNCRVVLVDTGSWARPPQSRSTATSPHVSQWRCGLKGRRWQNWGGGWRHWSWHPANWTWWPDGCNGSTSRAPQGRVRTSFAASLTLGWPVFSVCWCSVRGLWGEATEKHRSRQIIRMVPENEVSGWKTTVYSWLYVYSQEQSHLMSFQKLELNPMAASWKYSASKMSIFSI